MLGLWRQVIASKPTRKNFQLIKFYSLKSIIETGTELRCIVNSVAGAPCTPTLSSNDGKFIFCEHGVISVVCEQRLLLKLKKI